jgi:hypothetical protein
MGPTRMCIYYGERICHVSKVMIDRFTGIDGFAGEHMNIWNEQVFSVVDREVPWRRLAMLEPAPEIEDGRDVLRTWNLVTVPENDSRSRGSSRYRRAVTIASKDLVTILENDSRSRGSSRYRRAVTGNVCYGSRSRLQHSLYSWSQIASLRNVLKIADKNSW